MNGTDKKEGFMSRKLPEGCKPLPTAASLALTAVSGVLCGLLTSGYGGLLFFCISSALFAFVLTADFKPVYIIAAAAVALAASLASGVRGVVCLAALSFIPVAFLLSETVRKKKSLSVAVIVITVALAVMAGVGAAAVLTAGGGDFSVLTGRLEEARSAVTEYLTSFSYTAPDGTSFGFSENDVSQIIAGMVMQLPSLVVLFFFAVSYITAKIYRAVAAVLDCSAMFPGGRWCVTAGLPASLLFAASYLITALSYKTSVVYYTAVNLLYMLLPAMAITGFGYMFGRESRFRRGMSGPFKALMIFMCLAALYLNPVMLLVLAAFFTLAENIKAWRNKKSGGKF